MGRDPRAYLWDARAGAGNIPDFTRGWSLDDYLADTSPQASVVVAPARYIGQGVAHE